VFVKSVAADGTVSEMSTSSNSSGIPPPPNSRFAPFPAGARVAAINTNFAFGLGASSYVQSTRANHTGAVVERRVSNFQFRRCGPSGATSAIAQWHINPLSLLFTNAAGGKHFSAGALPFPSHQRRLPESLGEIFQVSPLWRTLPTSITNYTVDFGGGSLRITNSILWDSYIVYDLYPIADLMNFFFFLSAGIPTGHLRRAVPLLLVRFRKNGEIAEVLPTNEMEVP
jgi:hypothetical protein